MFRSIKKNLRHFLTRQILLQLSEESPELRQCLIEALTPGVRLQMGIPAPLGDPVPHPSNQYGHKTYCEIFLQRHWQPQTPVQATRALDLGCGNAPHNPFRATQIQGCDLRGSDDGSVQAVDLFQQPIPHANTSFDFVTAFDFIEHIPRVLSTTSGTTRFPFVELMDEVHRVLKPGGLFLSRTPAFLSREAFQDPTHVNIVTDLTFVRYFCSHSDGDPWARMYGFQGTFELVAQDWCHAWLFSLLRRSSRPSA